MRAIFIIISLAINLTAFKALSSETKFQKKLDTLLGEVNLHSYSEESLRDLLALRWNKKRVPRGIN